MAFLGGFFGGGKTTVTQASDQNVDVETIVDNKVEVSISNIVDMVGIGQGLSDIGKALTDAATAQAVAAERTADTFKGAAEALGASLAKTAGETVATVTDAAATTASENRKALVEWGQAAAALLMVVAAIFALTRGGPVKVSI
jgi:hypothetical protein